jgi:hypothetical protein
VTGPPLEQPETDLPVCPACGSADAPLTIKYGLIRFESEEQAAAFHASGYVWGGCVLPGPNRQCRSCRTRFQFGTPELW